MVGFFLSCSCLCFCFLSNAVIMCTGIFVGQRDEGIFLLVYNVKASFRGHQVCCSLFPCLLWNNLLVIKR